MIPWNAFVISCSFASTIFLKYFVNKMFSLKAWYGVIYFSWNWYNTTQGTMCGTFLVSHLNACLHIKISIPIILFTSLFLKYFYKLKRKHGTIVYFSSTEKTKLSTECTSDLYLTCSTQLTVKNNIYSDLSCIFI